MHRLRQARLRNGESVDPELVVEYVLSDAFESEVRAGVDIRAPEENSGLTQAKAVAHHVVARKLGETPVAVSATLPELYRLAGRATAEVDGSTRLLSAIAADL